MRAGLLLFLSLWLRGPCCSHPLPAPPKAKSMPTTARILWKHLDDEPYDAKKSLGLHLNPDGKFHAYRVNLASSFEYRNLASQSNS